MSETKRVLAVAETWDLETAKQKAETLIDKCERRKPLYVVNREHKYRVSKAAKALVRAIDEVLKSHAVSDCPIGSDEPPDEEWMDELEDELECEYDE